METLGEEARLERPEVRGEARGEGGEFGGRKRLEVPWRRRTRRAGGGEGNGAVLVEARGGDEVGDDAACGLFRRGVAGAAAVVVVVVCFLALSTTSDLPPLSEGVSQGRELLVEARSTCDDLFIRDFEGEEVMNSRRA